MDRALEIPQAHSIEAFLGTPTASPPPWVLSMLPNVYRFLTSGLRRTYGNRRGYCPFYPGYRERGRIYLRTPWNRDHHVDTAAIALGHDTIHGLKRQNFWLMEQQSGCDGW